MFLPLLTAKNVFLNTTYSRPHQDSIDKLNLSETQSQPFLRNLVLFIPEKLQIDVDSNSLFWKKIFILLLHASPLPSPVSLQWMKKALE